jgi:hypothetical protein
MKEKSTEELLLKIEELESRLAESEHWLKLSRQEK